jgi:hypothetical protein
MMTIDRRDKRSARTSHLDVECLGERIAPAVYRAGIVRDLALKWESPSQLKALLKEFRQDGIQAHLNQRLGIIVVDKMSLGVRSIVTSIISKAPVKPVPVFPVSGSHPVNSPLDGVFLNITTAPVKPVPVTPVIPPTPVNSPLGAVSLNIPKPPVKPITVTPVVPQQPVNIPLDVVSLNIPTPPVKPVPVVTPVPDNPAWISR